MLKGIDPLLSPDVLHALSSMGHADEVVIVDSNYPAFTSAASTTYGKVLRMDGANVTQAIRAILSVMPVDNFVKDSAERMQVDGAPEELPPVQKEVQAEIDKAEGKSTPLKGVERQEFYKRAKSAFCIIATGESRGWGCFILKKGVILPAGTAGAPAVK